MAGTEENMKIRLLLFALLVTSFCLWNVEAKENQYRGMKLLSTGWIKGRVTYTNGHPEVPKLNTDFDVPICGSGPKTIEAVDISPDSALRNVVVYLKDITEGKELLLGTEPPVLIQEHCGFSPHVQVVPTASSIRILNRDNVLHGVHALQYDFGTKFVLYPNSISFPARTLFNIAMVAQRKESYQQVGGPGLVKFVCEAGHKWMTAYVVVAAHPYFIKVSDDGTYALGDVPPGKYTLVAWHEYFGVKETKVEVKANQPSVVNFEYTESL
jgi:hypothetical protein